MTLSLKVIAIDGTFASGKGTLAKRLATHYALRYLDTGKLYRATAKAVLDAGGDPDNEGDAVRAAQVLKGLNLSQILEDVSLKSGPVGAAASKVAVFTDVRAALFDLQRDFATQGAVLDGRDIGTVICPDADVKIYVDAEPEVRAKRRHAELVGYGENIDYETVLSQLKERDSRDMNRKDAPLKPAHDAHLLDTSKLGVEEAFSAACQIIEAAMAIKS